VRIVNKTKVENIKKAVSEISTYSQAELEFNRNHNVTPWAAMAMYLISKEGETAQSASSHYGRKYGAVHAATKKIEANIEKYTPYLNQILERAEQCGC
jgi:excinuclease UvrABC helicase subunit UvrB|tara:strand:+ start:4032 stop:4325 length:294 start_codon:yes stop_codon:yes gene_type:complete